MCIKIFRIYYAEHNSVFLHYNIIIPRHNDRRTPNAFNTGSGCNYYDSGSGSTAWFSIPRFAYYVTPEGRAYAFVKIITSSIIIRRHCCTATRSTVLASMYKVSFVIYLNDYYYYCYIRPPPVPLNNSVKIGSTIESSLGMRKKNKSYYARTKYTLL